MENYIADSIECEKIEVIYCALENFAEKLKHVFDAGLVTVCGDETLGELTERVQRSLTNGGYIVRRLDINSKSDRGALAIFDKLPEGSKHLVAVGSGGVCDLVKAAARERGIDWSVVATAPSTEGYFTCYAEFEKQNEWLKCALPRLVAADFNVFDNCPVEMFAAGVGRVAAWWLKCFDLKYLGVADGGDIRREVSTLSDAIAEFFAEQSIKGLGKRLFDALAEIGRVACVFLPRANSVENFLGANLKGRLQGENSFLAAHLVQNLYRSYLSKQKNDTLPPPDIIKSLKLVEKYCGWGYNKLIKERQPFLKEQYFRKQFILNEYRADLLAELNRVDLSQGSRLWRRLYSDAGFWLKNYVSTTSLLRLTSMSAAFGDGLLADIKQSGFLESFA